MNKAEEIEPSIDPERVNSHARSMALQAAGRVAIEPTSLVPYRSNGGLLIIGEPAQALNLGKALEESGLRCFILAQGGGIDPTHGDLPMLFVGQSTDIRIAGHLGAFTVTLVSKERGEVDVARLIEAEDSHFDLVLDLDPRPSHGWEVPPFGYYAPGDDPAELERMLAELPTMVGEFEKAQFFQYNADICAHGNSGLKGCTRCLDACPTGAIISLGDAIQVDPHACQGAGSCATACPSGAIIYSFPNPADTLRRLRILLGAYREAGGDTPVLLFHDAEAGTEALTNLDDPPGHVIPIEIEEVGSVGMDVWLAALAYGARQVLMLATDKTPPSVLREIREQMEYAHALLEALGYPRAALSLLNEPDRDALSTELEQGLMPSIEPASFAGSNAKRDTLFYAIDYLAAQSPPLESVIPLPQRAPFGEVRVDRQGCTLCMACVSVCPSSALFDGGDQPRLEFLEANCVQCGLCEQACPEHVITREFRFVFDQQQRRRRRVLNEEAAFHCTACGKPFATRSMIEMMTAKLQGHSMFQEKGSIERLKMCGDCRVRHMFTDEQGVPQ